MRVRKAPEAGAAVQETPPAKRHARGAGTAAALMAVRAYYTPETSQKYPTKKAAAQAHGVSACAPLFATYEKQLRQTPDVMAMITNREMPRRLSLQS